MLEFQLKQIRITNCKNIFKATLIIYECQNMDIHYKKGSFRCWNALKDN